MVFRSCCRKTARRLGAQASASIDSLARKGAVVKEGQRPAPVSRRELLKQAAMAGVCLPLGLLDGFRNPALTPFRDPTPPQGKLLSQEDELLLEEIEHASFLYFWEQANPQTGMVKDRCNARAPDNNVLGNISATGFGLTAICIGEHRGYISYAQARDRVTNTLRFLWEKLPTHRGFFYHWTNINTGTRVWDSEVSSVDTAILLCGVLTCRQHFIRSPEIGDLAERIYHRVNWAWLSEDTLILPGGWTPETGFLQYRWNNYSELMMIYLLGIGSSQHPLGAGSWDAWKRDTFDYDGIRYVGSAAPLFVNQYPQAWFDFRNKHDKYADYFQNSIVATDVHRRFCVTELQKEFPDYTDDLWGITASDSVHGYEVWGGPPKTGPIDGTIVPCATGGSLVFLTAACMRVLRNIRFNYGAGTWSKYGFVDAFNPLINWYDTDVIGIDTGITMLMAENARTGFVWETFMKNPEAQKGMQLAGFQHYDAPLPQEYLPRPAPNLSNGSAGGSAASWLAAADQRLPLEGSAKR
jgi:hypothetical protein